MVKRKFCTFQCNGVCRESILRRKKSLQNEHFNGTVKLDGMK